MMNPLNRRQMLQTLGVGLFATQLPALAHAKPVRKPVTGPPVETEWKNYKIQSRFAPSRPVANIILPLPKQVDTTYQKSSDLNIKGNFESVQMVRDPLYNADALLATFDKKNKTPFLEVGMTIATRDRVRPEPLAPNEDVGLYLKPTKHIPLDGLVKETSQKIVKSLEDADAKALAIHHWIVDATFRDPKVRGCGVGDINATLKIDNLGGKCADLSSLFVGLCRASGVPAREVFGLRVGDSKQFASIGKSGTISKAQHCRAEYFSPKRGWVPVDPADVRKVILEEKLTLQDPKVQSIRDKFFGFWEMNWIAYNSARDFKFSQVDDELNFLMYPQSVGAVLDSLDPDQFKYSIQTV